MIIKTRKRLKVVKTIKSGHEEDVEYEAKTEEEIAEVLVETEKAIEMSKEMMHKNQNIKSKILRKLMIRLKKKTNIMIMKIVDKIIEANTVRDVVISKVVEMVEVAGANVEEQITRMITETLANEHMTRRKSTIKKDKMAKMRRAAK